MSHPCSCANPLLCLPLWCSAGFKAFRLCGSIFEAPSASNMLPINITGEESHIMDCIVLRSPLSIFTRDILSVLVEVKSDQPLVVLDCLFLLLLCCGLGSAPRNMTKKHKLEIKCSAYYYNNTASTKQAFCVIKWGFAAGPLISEICWFYKWKYQL